MGREDQLPTGPYQCIDRVQQLGQSRLFAGKELDVVNQQQLNATVLAAKAWQSGAA